VFGSFVRCVDGVRFRTVRTVTDMTGPADQATLEHRAEGGLLSWRFADLSNGLGEGRAAWVRQMRSLARGQRRIEVVRTVATERRFVAEREEHQELEGETRTARRLCRCETVAGRIVDSVGFCTGEWDEELRARHAAEAPMLPPWSWPV
jgi:hypothetical protein